MLCNPTESLQQLADWTVANFVTLPKVDDLENEDVLQDSGVYMPLKFFFFTVQFVKEMRRDPFDNGSLGGAAYVVMVLMSSRYPNYAKKKILAIPV